MVTHDSSIGRPWRVCVTRDEGPSGPLTLALRACRFEPVSCPALIEEALAEPAELGRVAARLERYDWMVCASARGVRALAAARRSAWPRGLRTAAVGSKTAEALMTAGADPLPVVAEGDGAEALWSALRHAVRWEGLRVLVPTTTGGRRTLIDGLRSAGAIVEEVEVYRMSARDASSIAADWAAAAPDAVVVTSPRAAEALSGAIGAQALRQLRAVVAIGPTTADALARLSVPCLAPRTADFGEAARALAARRDAADKPGAGAHA